MSRNQSISIGIATPLSGSAAALGKEMKQAIELAIEEKNASGGIRGTSIIAEVADDGSDPQKGKAIAQDFGNNTDLIAAIGHYNSDVSIAAAGVYNEYDLAMINPIASNPELTEHGLPNIFRYTNRDDETARAIAGYLFNTLHKRRAVIIEGATAYGKSMAGHFRSAFDELDGSIIYYEQLKKEEQDYEGLVSRLPQDFDFLFYGGSFEGASILMAMRKAGLKQLFAAGDGCWDLANFLRPAGNAASEGEGVLILSASHAAGHAKGSPEFAEKYDQRYGPIINYALNCYDCANLLIRSIEHAANLKSGIPGRTDVLSALRNIKFQGIGNSHPVQWNLKGDNVSAITMLNVVKNGRFHEIAEIASFSDHQDHRLNFFRV